MIGSSASDSRSTPPPGASDPSDDVRAALRPLPTEPSTARLDATLPDNDQAPRVAHRQLATWLAPQLDEREVYDARLLISELVTNALVHGRGTIEMHARLDERRLIVEVTDDGNGFERIARESGCDSVGGWGLTLVDTLASRWGIHEGSSHVWFELKRHADPVSARQQTPH